MEFTYKIEADGWALVTHDDGGQYRLRYDNQGGPLVPGELHLMIVDGQSETHRHVTRQTVALVRFVPEGKGVTADEVCLTAPRILDTLGYPCIGDNYVTAVVRLVEVSENADWTVESLGGEYRETITTKDNKYDA